MPREPPKTMAIFPQSPRFSFTSISVVDRSVHKWVRVNHARLSCLARSKAVDSKSGQCAQTPSVAPRTGAELNALHRHLQKGGGFAGVDGEVDFSAGLPLTDAFNQAPEEPWTHFAPQHHKLRISSPKFTDGTDAHAPECTYAVIFGNEA